VAKVGRNDPCPCGSGRKYKQCCGQNAADGVVPTEIRVGASISPLAPRPTERALRDITRAIGEQGFSTISEVNAFLKDFMAEGAPHRTPDRPVDEAQDLVEQAWQAEGQQRVKLARQALKISPDCSDAYVLLAEETARSPHEQLNLFEQAVAAGERALGPEAFESFAGHFWGVIQTRPYMRARSGLVMRLWELGRRQEAITHYREMLRLNPGDNQGVRYPLLAWLLEVGDQDAVRDLLDQYPDDIAASWAYGKALCLYRTGGRTRTARSALVRARERNRHVPAYLLGSKQIPRRLPDYIGVGDESEAVACASEQRLAWLQTAGALEWLETAR